MSDRKRKYQNDAPWLAGAVLIALVIAGRQLWLPAMPNGHDTLEYPARLAEFMINLKNGILFPLWAPDFSGGYGQPFFMFNPPLSYYIASAFYAVGFSMTASWNGMALVTLFMMALFMYGFAREYFPPRGAFLASALYTLAPYTLAEIYVRCALAEFLAMAWLPLIFRGAKRAVENGRPRDILLTAVGVCLLLLTHNPASLICAPFLAAYVIFLSIRNKSIKGLIAAGIAGVLGIGLSAWFLLPAFFQKHLVSVDLLRRDAQLGYVHHFWAASNWVTPNWRLNDQIGLGLVHLAAVGCAAVVVFFGRKKNRSHLSLFFFFLLAVAVALVMSHPVSKAIWDRIPTLQYMQFPWRFFIFIAFGMAVMGGLCHGSAKKPGAALPWVIFLAILAAVLAFPHAKTEHPAAISDEYFSPESIVKNNLSATTRREYRPAGAPMWPATCQDLILLPAPGTTTITLRTPEKIVATIEAANGGSGFFRQFHFPGWTCRIDDAPVELKREPTTGGMQFAVPAGTHTLRLALEKTRLQKIASLISIVSVILVSGLAIVSIREKMNKGD